MSAHEYGNGVAYVERGTTVLFPFGTAPQLLLWDAIVTIEQPERYGEWDTAQERRAFVRAFIDDLKHDQEDAR